MMMMMKLKGGNRVNTKQSDPCYNLKIDCPTP